MAKSSRLNAPSDWAMRKTTVIIAVPTSPPAAPTTPSARIPARLSNSSASVRPSSLTGGSSTPDDVLPWCVVHGSGRSGSPHTLGHQRSVSDVCHALAFTHTAELIKLFLDNIHHGVNGETVTLGTSVRSSSKYSRCPCCWGQLSGWSSWHTPCTTRSSTATTGAERTRRRQVRAARDGRVANRRHGGAEGVPLVSISAIIVVSLIGWTSRTA